MDYSMGGRACQISTHLLRDAVQHQLSRTVSRAHIQENIPRSREFAQVLSFVQIF